LTAAYYPSSCAIDGAHPNTAIPAGKRVKKGREAVANSPKSPLYVKGEGYAFNVYSSYTLTLLGSTAVGGVAVLVTLV